MQTKTRNMYIYCEGQTEEMFVNKILMPYFLNLNIFVQPIVCTTKRTGNIKHRGGVTTYQKIKEELQRICKNHKNEFVSTMFDYYAMPSDTPGITDTQVDLYKRMDFIEAQITEDIGAKNCFFNLMLHEFEGLLFSDPKAFSFVTADENVQMLQAIRDEAQSPEHINNHAETAPSKRIKKIIPGYSKVINATVLSEQIGIESMMRECLHFRQWIEKIRHTFER